MIFKLTVILLAAVADAQWSSPFSKIQTLSANDIGEFHTKVFDEVRVMFSKEVSKNITTFQRNFYQVMISYCDEDIQECHDAIDDAEDEAETYITTRADDLTTGRVQAIYPDDMDSPLKASIDKLFNELATLGKHNLDEKLKAISNIETKISNMRFLQPGYKNMALSAASVARESTRLWHGAFNDPDHAFYELSCPTDTKEYENNDWRMISTVSADIVGVLLTPLFFFAWPVTLTMIPFAGSITAMYCLLPQIFPGICETVVAGFALLAFFPISVPPAFSQIAFSNQAAECAGTESTE